MKPFMVRPEWRERQLYIGRSNVGRVFQVHRGTKWEAINLLRSVSLGTFPTEAEARAAVEAAVARELTGEE